MSIQALGATTRARETTARAKVSAASRRLDEQSEHSRTTFVVDDETVAPAGHVLSPRLPVKAGRRP